MSYGAIILAAGDGKRMQSKLPKVLHNFAGTPILFGIIRETLKILDLKEIVIVAGASLEQLKIAYENSESRHDSRIVWANQALPIGTADAVATGLQYLNPKIQKVLILSGDLPLISMLSLNALIKNTYDNAIGILTSNVNQPYGLGRIVRNDQNKFLKIVEEVEANDLEKNIKEVNVGVYLFPKKFLDSNLPKLNNHNKQKEYYLTEIFKFTESSKSEVYSANPLNYLESFSINTRKQLIDLERKYNIQQANKLLEQGVTVVDPNRLDIRGEVQIDSDVEIDINVILIGQVIIESGAKIGANCYIKDSTIGSGVIIEPNSVIDGAIIEQQAKIGPFARIRPNSHIKSYAKIGNFVEIKSSIVGMYSKVNHLSYIGDGNIGQKVNVGAGVITCNYDGINKHITVVEDNVSIGAGSQLIAPIVIEKSATIAAGTTLLKNAPGYQLTLNKKMQYSIEWQRPIKINDKSETYKNQFIIEK